MAKKLVETVLKNSEETLHFKTMAIVNRTSIKFNENNVVVSIKILDDSLSISRQNDEYQLKLNFKNNTKTKGIYILKKMNMNFDLDILTKELKINDNFMKIVYQLNDELYEYLITIRECCND